MCLSERNPRMRPEPSRTVCDNWAQVRNVGLAAQISDLEFHGGQEGGSGWSKSTGLGPGTVRGF